MTTARGFQTVVTDVNLFQAAKEIREWLARLSGAIPRLNESPNPYYGATADGLVLIGYYGLPSCVGTPLGSWVCTGGGRLKNEHWFDEACERLGLVELYPETNMENGTYGPVHAITKSLDGFPLPETVWNMHGVGLGFVSDTAFGDTTFAPAANKDTAERTQELRDHLLEFDGPGAVAFEQRLLDVSHRVLTKPVSSFSKANMSNLHYIAAKVYWDRLKKELNFSDCND